MRSKAAALAAAVIMGLLGGCEIGDGKPPAPKAPPRVVQAARSGMHYEGGGRGATVYHTERTPTGGWVIYFQSKPSDPFLIYPPVTTPGLGANENPREPKPIQYRYGRVIVLRSGDVRRVDMTSDKDRFRPLHFGD